MAFSSSLAWRLSAFYFFYFAVLGGFMPYWGLYLKNQHFDEAAIGQLLAISMLTRIFAPSFWGYLADSTGKRIELVRLGASMVTLFWVGIFFVGQSFWLMAAVLFSYSFFQNAILAQFEAVTMYHLQSSRADYGKIRLWGSLGFIATVAGLGVLFDWVAISWLPLTLLLCAFVAAAISFYIPPPPVQISHALKKPLLDTLKQSKVWRFLVVHFLLQLSHAPYYSFFSVYLEEKGYSRTVIGFLWSLGVLAEVVAFTQTQRLLSKFSEYNLIQCCLLLAAIRWFAIAWAVDIPSILWTVQLLHAFSFAVFHALAMQFIFREFEPQQQGQGQALYSALWGFGVAIGSWLTGMVWLSWGADMIYSVAALCCVAAMLIIKDSNVKVCNTLVHK
ncbi:MAG: MFS transporter [Moraxellaceae bacterium]|nr:MFS transporter [Moraxellaceae bacterium]